MENTIPPTIPKKKTYKKILRMIPIFLCLFLLFGHIPLNYFNSYKRAQTYKTKIYQCADSLPTQNKYTLEDKICSCAAGRIEDTDRKRVRKIQANYYSDMRAKYNLSKIFLCEARDAQNDTLLRGVGDTFR